LPGCAVAAAGTSYLLARNFLPLYKAISAKVLGKLRSIPTASMPETRIARQSAGDSFLPDATSDLRPSAFNFA
jgi:hypothetical protein